MSNTFNFRKVKKLGSFKFFPNKDRTRIEAMGGVWNRGEYTKKEAIQTRRALKIAEDDLRNVLREAGGIMNRYDNLRNEMTKYGFLLYDMPVFPEHAGFKLSELNNGFEKVVIGEFSTEKQVYRKDGVTIWHLQESIWVVKGKRWEMPITMDLQNMSVFITAMRSLGVSMDIDKIYASG